MKMPVNASQIDLICITNYPVEMRTSHEIHIFRLVLIEGSIWEVGSVALQFRKFHSYQQIFGSVGRRNKNIHV